MDVLSTNVSQQTRMHGKRAAYDGMGVELRRCEQVQHVFRCYDRVRESEECGSERDTRLWMHR
jgi:hypothetical protein